MTDKSIVTNTVTHVLNGQKRQVPDPNNGKITELSASVVPLEDLPPPICAKLRFVPGRSEPGPSCPIAALKITTVLPDGMCNSVDYRVLLERGRVMKQFITHEKGGTSLDFVFTLINKEWSEGIAQEPPVKPAPAPAPAPAPVPRKSAKARPVSTQAQLPSPPSRQPEASSVSSDSVDGVAMQSAAEDSKPDTSGSVRMVTAPSASLSAADPRTGANTVTSGVHLPSPAPVPVSATPASDSAAYFDEFAETDATVDIDDGGVGFASPRSIEDVAASSDASVKAQSTSSAMVSSRALPASPAAVGRNTATSSSYPVVAPSGQASGLSFPHLPSSSIAATSAAAGGSIGVGRSRDRHGSGGESVASSASGSADSVDDGLSGLAAAPHPLSTKGSAAAVHASGDSALDDPFYVSIAGKWAIDPAASDSLDPLWRSLGMGWLRRQGLKSAAAARSAGSSSGSAITIKHSRNHFLLRDQSLWNYDVSPLPLKGQWVASARKTSGGSSGGGGPPPRSRRVIQLEGSGDLGPCWLGPVPSAAIAAAAAASLVAAGGSGSGSARSSSSASAAFPSSGGISQLVITEPQLRSLAAENSPHASPPSKGGNSSKVARYSQLPLPAEHLCRAHLRMEMVPLPHATQTPPSSSASFPANSSIIGPDGTPIYSPPVFPLFQLDFQLVDRGTIKQSLRHLSASGAVIVSATRTLRRVERPVQASLAGRLEAARTRHCVAILSARRAAADALVARLTTSKQQQPPSAIAHDAISAVHPVAAASPAEARFATFSDALTPSSSRPVLSSSSPSPLLLQSSSPPLPTPPTAASVPPSSSSPGSHTTAVPGNPDVTTYPEDDIDVSRQTQARRQASRGSPAAVGAASSPAAPAPVAPVLNQTVSLSPIRAAADIDVTSQATPTAPAVTGSTATSLLLSPPPALMSPDIDASARLTEAIVTTAPMTSAAGPALPARVSPHLHDHHHMSPDEAVEIALPQSPQVADVDGSSPLASPPTDVTASYASINAATPVAHSSGVHESDGAAASEVEHGAVASAAAVGEESAAATVVVLAVASPATSPGTLPCATATTAAADVRASSAASSSASAAAAILPFPSPTSTTSSSLSKPPEAPSSPLVSSSLASPSPSLHHPHGHAMLLDSSTFLSPIKHVPEDDTMTALTSDPASTFKHGPEPEGEIFHAALSSVPAASGATAAEPAPVGSDTAAAKVPVIAVATPVQQPLSAIDAPSEGGAATTASASDRAVASTDAASTRTGVTSFPVPSPVPTAASLPETVPPLEVPTAAADAAAEEDALEASQLAAFAAAEEAPPSYGNVTLLLDQIPFNAIVRAGPPASAAANQSAVLETSVVHDPEDRRPPEAPAGAPPATANPAANPVPAATAVASRAAVHAVSFAAPKIPTQHPSPSMTSVLAVSSAAAAPAVSAHAAPVEASLVISPSSAAVAAPATAADLPSLYSSRARSGSGASSVVSTGSRLSSRRSAVLTAGIGPGGATAAAGSKKAKKAPHVPVPPAAASGETASASSSRRGSLASSASASAAATLGADARPSLPPARAPGLTPAAAPLTTGIQPAAAAAAAVAHAQARQPPQTNNNSSSSSNNSSSATGTSSGHLPVLHEVMDAVDIDD